MTATKPTPQQTHALLSCSVAHLTASESPQSKRRRDKQHTAGGGTRKGDKKDTLAAAAGGGETPVPPAQTGEAAGLPRAADNRSHTHTNPPLPTPAPITSPLRHR